MRVCISTEIGTRSERAGRGLLLLPLLALLALASLACSGDANDVEEPAFLMTGSQGLFILTESQRTRLLHYPDGTFLLDPAVSPDGKTYAFTRQPPAIRGASGQVDFGSDLMLVDSDGKNPREVLRHSLIGEFIRNPIFLDAENLLINVRGRSLNGAADFRIERLSLATGQRDRLIENATSPALSVDRKTLAYVALEPATMLEALMVVDLQTMQPRELIPFGAPLVLMQNLAWSPDGSELAFMSSDLTAGAASPSAQPHPTLQDLWLINADGSDRRRVAELVENGPSPAWSADGSQIYIMASSGFLKFTPATSLYHTLGPGETGGQIARIR